MWLEDLLLIITGTLTALVAGLFFGFAVAVNRGLHRLTDSEYVRAMQSINAAILNPVFFVTFIGPVLLLPAAIFLEHANPLRFYLLLGAGLLYIAGTFGLTIAGNVPLNRKLETFSVSGASEGEIARARAGFEPRWNQFHAIRTVASVAATVLIFAACLSQASEF